MNLKTIGIGIIIIGAIMVFYTGFNYVTTEKVVAFGPIEINRQQNHPVQWSPIVGIVLIIVGGILVIRDKK
ncbi:hypothetical protein [Flavobacterium granuli]|uniref:Uncharacterized protein n=1 Tax=Flavobacterium granuli TaxID=280093 RepID=A0A1M5T2S7_9FLAO|nr:hypothetical protein [Flavobacterium granuli]PRZ20673.1 hypothetical protein BC624_11149 [Flavobacterium granuli]SHH44972.1 hypothetical protein SAMN05443373_11349 [Flavobacterium granuli]